MSKLTVFGALVLALLASALAYGHSAAQTPSAAPVSITSCATLTTSGAYILSDDLQSATGDCIDIAAANVSLDLGSHTIAGNGTGTGFGVHILDGAQDVRVANGTVSGFIYGVVSDAPYAHIARLTAEDNVTGGILLRNADNSHVGGSYLLDNAAYGITVQDSNGVSIVNSRSEGSGIYGIWLDGASYNFLSQNIVGPAGDAGIYLGCSANADFLAQDCAADTHNLISANHIDAGNGLGIVLSVHADANAIVGNTNSNGTYGAFDADATCGANDWEQNSFTATNATCIG